MAYFPMIQVPVFTKLNWRINSALSHHGQNLFLVRVVFIRIEKFPSIIITYNSTRNGEMTVITTSHGSSHQHIFDITTIKLTNFFK